MVIFLNQRQEKLEIVCIKSLKMPGITKRPVDEEDAPKLRINKGVELMLRKEDPPTPKETKLNLGEIKMLALTLTLSTLISVLFLAVGGIIGWLYKDHIQKTAPLPLHPEMFDEQGNVIPDEIITFRVENSDFLYSDLDDDYEED